MIPRRNLPRNLYKAFKQPRYALEVFTRRLRSFMSYKFQDGLSSYPESVVLLLTYQCNLRCKMCGQWGESGASKQYEQELLKEALSIDDYKKIIDEISLFRPRITLTGGEPLLYKNIDQLIGLIKAKGLHCFMISNGVLLGAHKEKILSSGLDELSISIDGPRDIHDHIRGVSGTFDALYANIKEMNAIKSARGAKKPYLNIVCTISNMNYHRLPEMLDVARDLEASVLSFHHLSFLDTDVMREHNEVFNRAFGVTSSDWGGFVLKDSKSLDPKILMDQLRKIKEMMRRNKYPFLVNFYPNFTNREIGDYYTLTRFTPTSYNKRCISPWMIVYVCPTGEVRPCFLLDYVAGNLKAKSFKEIWNDESFKKFRKVVKKEKYFPACTKCTEFYRY